MANRKIHYVESSESSSHFLYLKNQQMTMKAVSNCSKMPQHESSQSNSVGNTLQTIDTTVKHVGFGSYSRCMSYISFVDGVSTFSKAIELKPAVGPKGGRPRKVRTSKSATPSTQRRKKTKKRAVPTEPVDKQDTENKPVIHATTVVTQTSMADALSVIENRKKSIKAKLMLKRENLLTQEEEQDIHTRADIYAMTAIPEPEYYILPEDDPLPPPSLRLEDVHIVTAYPPSRKKRRRNYGTTNCYVNQHNDEDVFDNTKMLPLGTRLLKPPTKLVELVAHAIDGSPDGLLQVQQIYTYLQNKFPFFRYMERIAINSWRSSIRHALYQKWFRKIRFDLSYISSKGCYWAINHKTSPKEWTMPDSKPGQCGQAQEGTTDNVDLDELAIDPELHEHVCALLEEEKRTDTQYNSDVIAIAREFGISPYEAEEKEDPMIDVIDVDLLYDSMEDHRVPSPVREPDPILARCAPDWKLEDMYLTRSESGCSSLGSSIGSPPCVQLASPPGFSSPGYVQFSSPTLHPYTEDVHPEQYLGVGVPPQSPCSATVPNLVINKDGERRQLDGVCGQRQKVCPVSPLITWTPSWEEYGAYVLSPKNVTKLKVCKTEQPQEHFHCSADFDCLSPIDSACTDLQMYEDSNVSKDVYSSDSRSSDYEVIAEFSQEGFSSQDTVDVY